MEATSKGGGQLRKLNIIYFLSHMGNIEHPHLLRVHHLNNNGVYLRDVKKWLKDMRGKHMVEAFSWSYKRRYKSGYVWQDLTDDGDLISPISDNEYVIKGSEIIPNASLDHTNATQGRPSMHSSESPQCSSEISSFTTDDSEETNKNTAHNNHPDDSSSKSPSCTKSMSNSIFRSFLSCGAVDTKDSAQVMLNRANKSTDTNICKRGEPARVRTQKQKTSRESKKEAGLGNPKVVSAAYKPVAEPSCSQCRKPFKPEKLHSHMKSCKGMRANAKSSISTSAAAASAKKAPINSSNQESVTSYFLTS